MRGERAFVASSYGKPDSQLRVQVTDFDHGERVRRAATIFFPLLGGALLSLPIPAWHLFAVPGFLIAAVVLGMQRLRQTSRVDRIEGRCPACGDPQQLPVPRRLVLPTTVTCPGCGEFIKLQDSSAGA